MTEINLTDIRQINRHNSWTGKWYGPMEEPNPPGDSCVCAGCDAKRKTTSLNKELSNPETWIEGS